MTGASYNRGASKQDYQTPREFIRAVEHRFGKIAVDLAASEGNAQAQAWIGEERNSLSVDWHSEYGSKSLSSAHAPLAWLNPPYSDIAPWAKKCAEESDKCIDGKAIRIAFLVPASVGTNWWADHVHGNCQVYFLRPRLTFVGAKDPYPRDLALCLYRFRSLYEPWKWK